MVHRQADCHKANPNSRGLLAIDFDADYPLIYDDVADADVEDKYVKGDEGPLLVLRLTFLSSSAVYDEWHRTALFASSCIIFQYRIWMIYLIS